jgi:hypothetical protein
MFYQRDQDEPTYIQLPNGRTFHFEDVPGDMSCLFHSLMAGYTGRELRSTMAEALTSNSSFCRRFQFVYYPFLCTENPQEAFRGPGYNLQKLAGHLRNHGEMGTKTDMLLFCCLTGQNIVCVTDSEDFGYTENIFQIIDHFQHLLQNDNTVIPGGNFEMDNS